MDRKFVARWWHGHYQTVAPLAAAVGFHLVAGLAVLSWWMSPGTQVVFKNPWFLLLLLFVPLVVWRGMVAHRSMARMRHSLIQRLLVQNRGWRTHLFAVQTGLRALVVTLMAVALARPQDAGSRSRIDMEGIDIVLTLDLSGSMGAPDMNPTRLGAAKSVLQDFIKRRKNDRIGAVVFAENAYTLCPLTLDYSVLSQMIDELELGVIKGEGTAIGNAVGISINRLRKSDAKSKTIILVTDGASNEGNVSPEQAAKFAATLGIRIYTILVGQNENRASVNPALLKEMAEKTGGAFFAAAHSSDLRSSFHQILDALERSRIEDQGVVYAEVFNRFLWPALLLALLDLMVAVFVMRRIP